MGKQNANSADYHEEERLAAVVVLEQFNTYGTQVAAAVGLPVCLWPVDGRPLLDYTIQALVRSGIQEIILLSNSYSYEIRSYVMGSKWAKNHPKLIRFIPCSKARSLGECLKDLDQENIVNHRFLLIYGNGILLTSEKLTEFFDIHKRNLSKDKNCIMTMIHYPVESDEIQHPSYTDDQHSFIIRDSVTNRILDYTREKLNNHPIPMNLLQKSNANLEIVYCPLDFHLVVCETTVLHLFQDNFDLLTVEALIKEVLQSELIDSTIYSHLQNKGYFLSVHNLTLYIKGLLDVLRRWTFPLVPDLLVAKQRSPLSMMNVSASPQLQGKDSFSHLVSHSYPIAYEKHNIYKQGDTQLDRLSDIQQDVFIGHKSQISSGVCLRSAVIGQNCVIGKNSRIENSVLWNNVVIGENCTIKNSILCDNVTLKNNVRITKKTVLCKGVIIGNNIQIDEDIVIVSSNTNSFNAIIDEVEIDDDIQLASDAVRKTNSKRRRSSTRISERSISERSTSSHVDEPFVSDSDLVGTDGFGRKLIFITGHDSQGKHAEHADDSDDDDDDDDDDSSDEEKEVNPFNAWGQRIVNPIDKTTVNRTTNKQTVTSKPKPIKDDTDVEETSSSGDLSDDESSDDQDEISSEGDSDSNENNQSASDADLSSKTTGNMSERERECQKEVLSTLKRAYKKKSNIDDVLDELRTLKPTYAVSSTEFEQYIIYSMFVLPLHLRDIQQSKYFAVFKQTFEQTTGPVIKSYMKTKNEQSQKSLLNILHQTSLENIKPIGERVNAILNCLYDADLLDEDSCLRWYENIRSETANPPEETQPYYKGLNSFVDWLQNAEEESDDD